MLESRIRAIIKQGEGAQVEFKECNNALNKDIYETVCAFLNRSGGELLLGVSDDGAITGIAPERLTPFPKNPSIARVFKEIGRADELGSGTRNLFKYCKAYCGNDPQLLEEDIFKFILPLTPQVTPQVTQQVTPQATMQATMQATVQDARTQKILYFCKEPRTREEIQKHIEIQNRDYFRKTILNPLITKKLLFLTIPDKPKSPKQKYYSLNPGEAKK